jgi:C-terminal processing protease CtpA/Prc
MLRNGLQVLDGQGVCGWIVDVRGNTGGNMWPMLTGLDPLLGAAPFGSFVAPSAPSGLWVRYRGEIRPGPRSDRRAPFFPLRGAALPVALLLDGRTASAGEMTAIALIGRQGVRTFGAATAGYTTANEPFELPDGAEIALTSAFVRDRAGRDYRDTIVPDEPAPDALAAARRWLAEQPSCRR